MKRFSILDRQLHAHTDHVLEASAGTGKTFSIEHLVVRLLAETGSDPLVLTQILVMTFTRAATRELKSRIRANIERTCELLDPNCNVADCPDYVQALRELPDSEIKAIKRRLERALALFDEAQIFTIHSFCARMLRECHEASWAASDRDDPTLSLVELAQVIKDFLRTQLRSDWCRPAQLQIIAKNSDDFEKLQSDLLKTLLRGLPIQPVPGADTYFEQIKASMQTMRRRLNLTSAGIIADYEALCPTYIQGKKNKPLKSYRSAVVAFGQLFDKEEMTLEDFDTLIRDGVVLCRIFDPENNRKPPPDLQHPEFLETLREELLPLVDIARDSKQIFASVACECQKHVDRYIEQEELRGSNELLHRMADAVSNDPLFRARVASRYGYAIVDEFQDTDPLQWEILQGLFRRDPPTPMALVGDPKQAIYAFRQADIHTYFDATNSLPEESHACLDVNFRSCPELIAAINLLFSEQLSPGLMSRGFHPVQAGPKAAPSKLSDGKGAVHFCISEGAIGQSKKWPTEDLENGAFWPFVSDEILSLVAQGYDYRDIAILVRDRYQARRALDILQSYHIPSILERSGYVTDTAAFEGLADLLGTLLKPRDMALMVQTLGGPIFCQTSHQVQKWLADPSSLTFFYTLREALLTHGVSVCLDVLFNLSCFGESATLLETILRRQNGLEMYRNLRHLCDLLSESEQRQHVRPEGLLQALRDLQLLTQDEQDCVKIRDDGTQDAVKILTIHVSKGLEFPIVFAVGMVNRTSVTNKLIPSDRVQRMLVVHDETSDNSKQYLKEEDEEKVRQAYVAMTRAKDRLYVPIAIDTDHKEVTFGKASPIELLLARFGQPAASEQLIYNRIAALSEASICETIAAHASPDLISVQSIPQQYIVKRKLTSKPAVALYSPPIVHVPGAHLSMHSFTSLLSDRQDVEDVEAVIGVTPHDPQAIVKSIFTLPAGRETGVILHKFLQETPFDQVSREAMHDQLRDHRLTDWSDVIHDTIVATLQTPLPLISGDTELCTLSAHQQYRELEFIFPIDDAKPLGLVTSAQGYVKGFIDLIFRHEGRYYLVDWKSNWLGPDSSFYTQEHLDNAMAKGSYHLQARIYTEALRRYLRLVDPRPFEECFGGCLYLFLRGMSPHNPLGGIYSFNPLEFPVCSE